VQGLVAGLRRERKQAGFTLDCEGFARGGDCDVADWPAGQAIGGGKNLDGADEVEFVNGRNGKNNNSAARVRFGRGPGVALGGCWSFRGCQYARDFPVRQARTRILAENTMHLA